ncbi:hypothetical protein HHK36_005573 [Tetracentron sinense]|uniref:Uncharacterized protein n=1 Tax=Tetracentron sinense TaxID=13715 RepID=A0A834ZNJ5_TETSI|nr:hypothetical protein HHK36_005573 [Tetracentron sinense]
MVTCRLLGVILEQSSPEELQYKLSFTRGNNCMQEKVLLALQDSGVFTSGGLAKDKVLFCSTENGRSSFVRQLEPDWHIDTNPEIISQLANACHLSSFDWFRGSSNISFTFLQTDQNVLLLMCSTPQPWSSSSDSQREIS